MVLGRAQVAGGEICEDDDAAASDDENESDSACMGISVNRALLAAVPRSAAAREFFPRRIPDAEEGGDSPQPVVYPKQSQVAEQCFERIQQQVAAGNIGSLDDFEQFDFVVQVPDLNNLFNQTVDRLRGFFSDYQRRHSKDFFADPEHGDGASAASFVYKPSENGAEERARALRARIEAEPRTLFLFIHDEAHWQATRDGTAGQIINHDVLRLSRNVLTLFVSATPYNLQTQSSQVSDLPCNVRREGG